MSLAPEPSPGASYEAPKLPYLEASRSLPGPRGQYHLDRIVAPIKMLKSASPDLSRGPSYDLFLVSSESLGGWPPDTTSSEQISRPYPRPTKPQIPSRTQLATDCVGILVGKTWDPAHRFGGKLCLVLGSRTGPLKLHGSYCKLNKWAQIWAQNIGPNLAPRNSKYSVLFCSPWATIVGCHLGLPGILLFRRPKP